MACVGAAIYLNKRYAWCDNLIGTVADQTVLANAQKTLTIVPDVMRIFS